MQVIFKSILKEDLIDLQKIAIRTFTQSYAHLNSASNFSEYLEEAFAAEKLLLEIQNEESFSYFITSENKIIGYLKLNVGGSQTEAHNDDYLEIERIYLESSYKRKGIGNQMIQFALEKAKSCQKSKVWLGVWEENPEAILFYKQMGFKKKGSHIFKFGDEDQTDIIMEFMIP